MASEKSQYRTVALILVVFVLVVVGASILFYKFYQKKSAEANEVVGPRTSESKGYTYNEDMSGKYRELVKDRNAVEAAKAKRADKTSLAWLNEELGLQIKDYDEDIKSILKKLEELKNDQNIKDKQLQDRINALAKRLRNESTGSNARQQRGEDYYTDVNGVSYMSDKAIANEVKEFDSIVAALETVRGTSVQLINVKEKQGQGRGATLSSNSGFASKSSAPLRKQLEPKFSSTSNQDKIIYMQASDKIRVAELSLSINSDVGGVVVAKVMGGKYKDTIFKASSYTTKHGYVNFVFDRFETPDGRDGTCRAYPVDLSEFTPGLKANRDHHYGVRLIGPVFGSIVEGVGRILGRRTEPTVVIVEDTVVQSPQTDIDYNDALKGSAEDAGKILGDFFRKAGDRPVTDSVPLNQPIGIYLYSDAVL